MKTLALLMTTLFTLSAQAAPVFNIFELGVQPEKTAQYDAVGKHNIQTSLAREQGTLAMYSVKRSDDPNLAYMVELYADDAAYQAHRASPHFQHYLRDTGAMVNSWPDRAEDWFREIGVITADTDE